MSEEIRRRVAQMIIDSESMFRDMREHDRLSRESRGAARAALEAAGRLLAEHLFGARIGDALTYLEKTWRREQVFTFRIDDIILSTMRGLTEDDNIFLLLVFSGKVIKKDGTPGVRQESFRVSVGYTEGGFKYDKDELAKRSFSIKKVGHE